ncbi:MAG: bifunctional UDP-N-acetylglucosamine diphosphorylase/glucosamine-1-phosphate N-acetyltransferase GlmU [Pseudomonadota bacterium]
MSISLIILAAGKGTRMNSDLPKVLHPIGGAPMLHHAMQSGAALSPDNIVIVAGHGADQVRRSALEYDETAQIVLQQDQLGTGHAVYQARDTLKDVDGKIIVLYGDTPFIRQETLEKMVAAESDLVVLGFEAADPARYGRLIHDGDRLDRIVEFKDASDEERAVNLCNSGVMSGDARLMLDLVKALGNDNAAGEYYLTDLPALAKARGFTTSIVICDEAETIGIDSRVALAKAETMFQTSARTELLENGVTLQAPDSVFLSLDTHIGRDTLIEPNVIFGPGVTVESGATIRAFSHLEGCHVARGSVVGPYARLRPGAELAENTRIGNFVEIKNAQINEGAKVNHLSYIGDAHVGEASNIGAGTITCNYDGVMKHHTDIGAGVFVGSNTMLVAPVSVGDGAMTASGSVITSDVEPNALAIARAPQVEKSGMAKKLMEMLRAKKARRSRGN